MANNNVQRTLIIAKPDAVQRGLVGTVLGRLERRGLRIVALRLLHIDRDLAERHYGVHKGKPFFAGLVDYIISTPVVVAVFEGPNAVATARATIGATTPRSRDGDHPGRFRARNQPQSRTWVRLGGERAPRNRSLLPAGGACHIRRDIDQWVSES